MEGGIHRVYVWFVLICKLGPARCRASVWRKLKGAGTGMSAAALPSRCRYSPSPYSSHPSSRSVDHLEAKSVFFSADSHLVSRF